MRTLALLAALLAVTAAAPPRVPEGRLVWLDSLDLSKLMQRRGKPQANKALGGTPLTMAGKTYARGIGTRSISEFVLDLHGQAKRFHAVIGFDDSARAGKPDGTVRYEIWADDRRLADTGVMKLGDAPRALDLDVTGVHALTLLLDDGGDTSNGDIANWADAFIEMAPGATAQPGPYVAPPQPMPAIAPRDTSTLSISGPLLYGTTPGKPFLYRIPASGPRTLRFAAKGLPAGLAIDPGSGIIHGSVRKAGSYDIRLEALSNGARATRTLRIVARNNRLALTPPMGWNSWNVWGTAVDDAKVRAAADALVSSGLAAHGYDYVVIDDAWTSSRDANGELKPNEKFPDMTALAEYVHAKGLKIGIYSSPGPKTCGGFQGSYQHEVQDAATFARWGIDFLKHDWCSYDDIAPDRSLPELQKPYRLMSNALRAGPRDIVFSLCQYGYGDVWKWGGEVGGNLWRTTGDLLDMWANLDSVGFRQAGRERYVTHGRWNDTDMLVVGPVGWGPNLHPTRLTPNEQVLHLTLWAMQAAPLFIGADLTQLDPFTLALLTNDEVLDVTRDALAKAGARIWSQDRVEIWSRPLADGTVAVGLFNRGLEPRRIGASWRDLGLSGPQRVRDLWKREDAGTYRETFTASVPSHGAVLLKVGDPRPIKLPFD